MPSIAFPPSFHPPNISLKDIEPESTKMGFKPIEYNNEFLRGEGLRFAE